MVKVLLHKKEFSTDAIEEIRLDLFPLAEIFEFRVLKSYFIKNSILEVEFLWIKSFYDFNLMNITKFEKEIQQNKKNMAILDTTLNQMESK